MPLEIECPLCEPEIIVDEETEEETVKIVSFEHWQDYAHHLIEEHPTDNRAVWARRNLKMLEEQQIVFVPENEGMPDNMRMPFPETKALDVPKTKPAKVKPSKSEPSEQEPDMIAKPPEYLAEIMEKAVLEKAEQRLALSAAEKDPPNQTENFTETADRFKRRNLLYRIFVGPNKEERKAIQAIKKQEKLIKKAQKSAQQSKPEAVKKEPEPIPPKPAKIYCYICDNPHEFADTKSLAKHILNDHPCHICGQSFNNIKDYANHIFEEHPEDKKAIWAKDYLDGKVGVQNAKI